jgi:hypothetical protein
MQTDKSAIILEVQWMETEIPRIQEELDELKGMEQELLTTPLETVHQAYTSTYRAERKRAFLFYHRSRSVTPTRRGYRERMRDVGWFTILARLLILAAVALAVYVVYHNHQLGQTQRGVIWGSALLIVAMALAFAPALADLWWERRARRKAEVAVQEAKQSEAFFQEKHDRQVKLGQCRTRVADLQERLKFARLRLDELRKELTSSNHQGET